MALTSGRGGSTFASIFGMNIKLRRFASERTFYASGEFLIEGEAAVQEGMWMGGSKAKSIVE